MKRSQKKDESLDRLSSLGNRVRGENNLKGGRAHREDKREGWNPIRPEAENGEKV